MRLRSYCFGERMEKQHEQIGNGMMPEKRMRMCHEVDSIRM